MWERDLKLLECLLVFEIRSSFPLPCPVGHCHSAVVTAAATQMAELNTNTRFINDRMLTYAQRLTATLPEKLTKCFFVNSGSEANDLALQLAEVATGHSQCISLAGCYHGHLKDLRALSKDTATPTNSSCIAPTPDVYRGQYRDPKTAGVQYAGEIQKIIDCQTAEKKEIASFIHESVMFHAGMVVFPEGFLQAAYKSVREAGGLCIADEVGSGLGRVGEKFWGFELQGVCPDIVTLGKSMGNGHPVAAVITTREIADKFAVGCSYFNTFGGNPVSMAIAQSVLTVLEEEGLQENARKVGVFLLDKLSELQEKHASIGDVRGVGLCIGVEIVADRENREPAAAKAKEAVTRLREDHQIACAVDDIHGNVINVKPPMCFTMDNASDLISAFDLVLSQ
jgi:ethanolamine-phosphate phospho-lyase